VTLQNYRGCHDEFVTVLWAVELMELFYHCRVAILNECKKRSLISARWNVKPGSQSGTTLQTTYRRGCYSYRGVPYGIIGKITCEVEKRNCCRDSLQHAESMDHRKQLSRLSISTGIAGFPKKWSSKKNCCKGNSLPAFISSLRQNW